MQVSIVLFGDCEGVLGGLLGVVTAVDRCEDEVNIDCHRPLLGAVGAKSRRSTQTARLFILDADVVCMFETVVIATDGSASAERGVETALDLADRFDATVHALYVVDADDIRASPDEIRDDFENALENAGKEAINFVREHADGDIVTAVRRGRPAAEIIDYANSVDADVVAMGTRGRHGDHAFLLGSVAEAIVRRAPMPVLTVRQLEGDEQPPTR